jgi:DNA-directed RNA polymerase specialized sigma24 family protein
MFRGNVTHYRVHNFEDVVIFCHDVEKRLGQLSPLDQQLVKRIGLQQYTQGEAAGMLGISLRHCVRLYAEMLDHLTELLLQDRLLEPQNCCQGG